MKYFYILFLTLLLILQSNLTFAQPGPEKFGEVSDFYKNLTEVDYDSLASAVILFDVGEVYFDSQLHIIFKRQKRVKILNEAGYDRANVSIGYYAGDDLEKIKKIKAHVINLTENGETEITELQKDSFFDEDVDGEYKRLKFSFPAVRPGSIIEYEYEVRIKSPHLMPDWTFQDSEPVLYSEYKSTVPEIFRYRMLSQGDSRFDQTNENESFASYKPNVPGYVRTSAVQLATFEKTFIKKNVTAIRDEPYMRSISDYLSKIIFQFSEIRLPNSPVEPVINRWENLATELENHRLFGRAINSNRQFKKILEEIEGYPAESDMDNMVLIHDFVKSNMKWDESYGIVAADKLHNVYEKKTGSSADINLLLYSLLNEAGIKVTPIITSTRENGNVWKNNPFLSQFNDVLVLAEIEENRIILDATDPLRSYKVLPFRVLNSSGWLVDTDKTEFIEIVNSVPHAQTFQIFANVNEDGAIDVDFSSSETGYFDLYRKRGLQKADSKIDFIKNEVFGNLSEISVAEAEVEDQSGTPQFKIKSKITLESMAERINDLLFLNPIFLPNIDKNPLTSRERNFPVDFGFEHSYSYHFNISIPESYSIEELPKNKLLRSPDGSAEIRRLCQAEGGSIQLVLMFKLNRSVYAPEEYGMLREFFDQYYSITQEQIVLKEI